MLQTCIEYYCKQRQSTYQNALDSVINELKDDFETILTQKHVFKIEARDISKPITLYSLVNLSLSGVQNINQ